MSQPLHNYLRMFRRSAGLTQKELAYLLGIHSASPISRYERSLQEAIVKSFLAKQGSRANGNGQPHGNGNGHTQTGEGTPVPATILKIDGMQTRSGWRMYLAFNVEGKQLKLFGDKQHLCDALTGAGYRHHPNDIYPDMEFNLPCRVVTEMSKDGKYQNIVKVMSDRYTGGQR